MSYRWKPSKTAIREFARQMQEIEEFCEKNNIQQSAASDSYYFTINGQDYRVSNHSVEASDRGMYKTDACTGERVQVRDSYHPDGRDKQTVYIHASKTRIIEIYNKLLAGYVLDGNGNRKF